VVRVDRRSGNALFSRGERAAPESVRGRPSPSRYEPPFGVLTNGTAAAWSRDEQALKLWQSSDCLSNLMDSARNELCRCGSGKRYKHCCGAVIPIATSVPLPPRIPGATPGVADRSTAAGGDTTTLNVKPDASRGCGTCTACCDGWLTGTIRGYEMNVGHPCHFRGAGGCTIYEDRPAEPCRSFYCAWRLRGNPFPDAFRPDRLGVIVLPKQWRGRLAYYLVPAGHDPDATLLEWMRNYSTATGTPFLFKIEGRYRGCGSPEFRQDLVDRATRGEPLLPGLNPDGAGPCKMELHSSF
jgi:hypothetical protein